MDHDQDHIFNAEFRAAVDNVLAKTRDYQSAVAYNEPRLTQARNYFSALEKLIELYRSSKNIRSNDPPKETIPPDIIGMIGKLCGYLAVGRIPEPVRDVAIPGSHAPGPTERYDKQIAVTYLAAAAAGNIDDPAPIKSVAETFGANRRTVMDWRKKFQVLDIEPEKLPQLLKKAGDGHRLAARSHSAIARRDAKWSGTKTPPQSQVAVSKKRQQIIYEPKEELSRDERIADIKKAMGEKT
jgi:hypothetical protein